MNLKVLKKKEIEKAGKVPACPTARDRIVFICRPPFVLKRFNLRRWSFPQITVCFGETLSHGISYMSFMLPLLLSCTFSISLLLVVMTLLRFRRISLLERKVFRISLFLCHGLSLSNFYFYLFTFLNKLKCYILRWEYGHQNGPNRTEIL